MSQAKNQARNKHPAFSILIGEKVHTAHWDDKKGMYRVTFMYDGKQREAKGKTAADLQENAQRRWVEVQATSYCANKNLTIKQWFEEWKRQRMKAGIISPRTAFLYTEKFRRYLEPYIGSMKIKKLERHQIRELHIHIADKVSISTANAALSLLSTMLKGAVLEEIIDKNPSDYIPHIKDKDHINIRETVHRDISDTTTSKETTIFFSHCDSCYYKNALLFMYNTGVRAGECFGLEWKDIQWPDAEGKGGIVHIRRTVTTDEKGNWIIGKVPKTQASIRDLPINPEILAILEEQKAYYKGISERNVLDLAAPVFPNVYGGFSNVNNLDASMLHVIKKCEEAGELISKFTSHALRHTFASRAARKRELPGTTLMRLMGHANMHMLEEVYTHVNMEDKEKAMELMGEGDTSRKVIEFPAKETAN